MRNITLFWLCLVTLVLLICRQYTYPAVEYFTGIAMVKTTVKYPIASVRMKRCEDKGLSHIEKNVLDKFEKVNDETWNLYVPCGYTYVEKELSDNRHFKSRSSGTILGIQGADYFAAKDRAWRMLVKKYGRLRASIYMPESWVTYDQHDMESFVSQAKKNPNAMYIMKKNIQQQMGLHIFTDPSEAAAAWSNGFVVIQRILGNPFIINGRKINLRVYVLVVCDKNGKRLYVYEDGFVYYSKVPYVTGKTREEIITTGYIDRGVYEGNPLTFKDFIRYVHEHHGARYVDNFMRSRNYVLQGFMEAAQTHFCSEANNKVTFAQSFGIDIQPNKDLTDVKILEWNKGQSLEIMDARDGNLKQKMIDDIYRTIGVVNDGTPSGYVQIWSS